MDDPQMILDGALTYHVNLIKQFKGNGLRWKIKIFSSLNIHFDFFKNTDLMYFFYDSFNHVIIIIIIIKYLHAFQYCLKSMASSRKQSPVIKQ